MFKNYHCKRFSQPALYINVRELAVMLKFLKRIGPSLRMFVETVSPPEKLGDFD